MSLYIDDQKRKGGISDTLMMTLIFFGVFYLIFMFTTKDIKSEVDNPVVNTNNISTPATSLVKSISSVKDEDIEWETERYSMVFSSAYGTLKSIQLKDFKNAQGKYFDLTPDLNDTVKLPLIYELSGYTFNKGYNFIKKDNELIFFQVDNGLTLQKTYTFSQKDFALKINIKITNNRGQDVTTDAFLGWGKSLGPFVAKENRVQYDTVITQAYYDNITLKETNISKGNLSEVANAEWISIDNRYFLIAIMPEQKGLSLVNLRTLSESDPFSQFIQLGNRLTISPKSVIEQNFTVYIGPKKKELLTPFNKDLERVVERGWFFFPLLGSFLIWIVTIIQGVVGNYGLAIIIFAVLLRLVFHPLNMQSMIATARQGELQIKIQAIKEKYPEKQVQNMKIMELYKTEQISFMKGCLPLLIQIPFFITFYQELPHLIDLAQSKFLWIQDLSSPDTLYNIQAFKNLPILPYRINILPIIITIATMLQMKLTSKNQPSNAQTKIMMYTMPLVFLFILWNAPAALNLYWLAQTLATMGTQAYFNKNKIKILEKEKLKRKSKRSKKQRGK